GKPSWQEWLTLIEALLVLHGQVGIDLVVIDPLASFLPGRNENLAGAMLENLMPLQQLTARGLSVLLIHHPRKGASPAGQAARGSGALAAFVDVLVEMYWYGEPQTSDRRRRLLAFSRHEETCRNLVVALNPEGTEYTALPVEEDEEFSSHWSVLQMVLEDASQRLNCRQIVKQWPRDYPVPDEVTLWRVLQRGVATGRLLREGRGRRNDPFRYWLPGCEDNFPPPSEAGMEALREWNERNFRRVVENLNKRDDNGRNEPGGKRQE
ncbi:MAG TPA: AAA family ATPase, partial [Gemmataceae bacterium]|nr:AAA family ATPase [Gemmataceae bacterium]